MEKPNIVNSNKILHEMICMVTRQTELSYEDASKNLFKEKGDWVLEPKYNIGKKKEETDEPKSD